MFIVFILVISAAPAALTNSDCDFGDSHYARAVQLHDMGDYDRALQLYDCALQEDPDNAIIPVLIENVHEDIASAASAWSRRSDVEPDLVCDPALDHARLGAEAYEGGERDIAMIHLQCALLDDPYQEDVLNLMGKVHLDAGETHSAKHYYDRAHAVYAANSKTPTMDSVDTSAASAAPSGFVMPEWLTPYETAPSTQSQPRQIAVFTEHSRLIAQSEQMLIIADDDSLTTWRRMQEQYVERIMLFAPSGEMSVTIYARRAYTLAIKAQVTVTSSPLTPTSAPEAPISESLGPESVCELGRLYASQGNYAAAFNQFQSLIKHELVDQCPDKEPIAPARTVNRSPSATAIASTEASNADETFARAMQFYRARKLYAAGNTLLETLEINPGHTDARCQLGLIFTEWANYGGALAQFKRILADSPQDDCALEGRRLAVIDMLAMYVPLTVDDFFYHARTYARLEEWELARDAFLSGLAFDPHRNDVRCELGMIYVELGDDHAALNEFDRVMGQYEVDSCAWSNRDALLQRLRSE